MDVNSNVREMSFQNLVSQVVGLETANSADLSSMLTRIGEQVSAIVLFQPDDTVEDVLLIGRSFGYLLVERADEAPDVEVDLAAQSCGLSAARFDLFVDSLKARDIESYQAALLTGSSTNSRRHFSNRKISTMMAAPLWLMIGAALVLFVVSALFALFGGRSHHHVPTVAPVAATRPRPAPPAKSTSMSTTLPEQKTPRPPSNTGAQHKAVVLGYTPALRSDLASMGVSPGPELSMPSPASK